MEAGNINDGRPDAREGTVSVHQPAHTELTIQFEGMKPLKITGADLAGPVIITRDVYSDMHVFCMSTLRIPDDAPIHGSAEEQQAQIRELVHLDDRCLHFGAHAVVVGAALFVQRLQEALSKQEHWFRAATVEYYDEAIFHGSFTEQQAPFMKQERFAYQKEYRVCLLRPEPSDSPFLLDIGDISAFALKIPSNTVNSAMRVVPKQSAA